MKKSIRTVIVLLAAVILVSVIQGCTRIGMEPVPSPAGKSDPGASHSRGPAPTYYDFDDVLIPGELKLDGKSSFIQRSGDFPAGILVFYGRAEVTSLIRFFETNMARDNWRKGALLKSADTLLLFEKRNRRCIIVIRGKGFHPRVEVWVSPTGSTIG